MRYLQCLITSKEIQFHLTAFTLRSAQRHNVLFQVLLTDTSAGLGQQLALAAAHLPSAALKDLAHRTRSPQQRHLHNMQ